MGKKLLELVIEFERGEIKLPELQRAYVWKPRKVEALLDSLYKGWPVGSFYVWRPRYAQPTRQAAIARVLPGSSHAVLLLDGQQRLTSLSRAIEDESGSWWWRNRGCAPLLRHRCPRNRGQPWR